MPTELLTNYINRSNQRRQAGRASEALHDASLALALAPASAEARLCRALAFGELGRLAAAAADARLVGLPPSSPTGRAAASLLRRVELEGVSTAESVESVAPRISATRLRLHFGLPLPEPLTLGRWTTLSLRLTTEIGLTPPLDEAHGAPAAARLLLLPLPQLPPAGDGGTDTHSESAPQYTLEVRQAVEDPMTREPRLVRGAPSRVSRVVLQHGRAVVEVRASLAAGGLGDSALPPQPAVLWTEVEGAGRTGSASVLSAVSAPLSVVQAPSPSSSRAAAAAAEDALFEAQAGAPALADAPEGDEGPRLAEAAGAAAFRVAVAVAAAGRALDAIQCFRPFWLPGACLEAAPRPLLLAEGTASIAARVWDSGAFFARWLAHDARAPAWRGMRVLELGAGVGVSGLAAAALGARVLLTDLDEALPLLRLNARVNAQLCAHSPAVAPLAWGDAAATAAAAAAVWDAAAGEGDAGSLVLCSDLVYDPEQYGPLIETLVALAGAGHGGGGEAGGGGGGGGGGEGDGGGNGGGAGGLRVLMGHVSRHPDEHLFFREAARHFSVRVVHGPPLDCLAGGGDAGEVLARDSTSVESGVAVRVIQMVARQ